MTVYTNLWTNSTWAGATNGVIGSGGAVPTGMTVDAQGATITVTNSSIVNGYNVFGLRFQLTNTTGSAKAPAVKMLTTVAASTVYSHQIAGRTVSGGTDYDSRIFWEVHSEDGSGNYLAYHGASGFPSTFRLFQNTYTTAVGATKLVTALNVIVADGTALDATVEFAIPMVVLGSTLPPFIPTSGTAVAMDWRTVTTTGASSLIVGGAGANDPPSDVTSVVLEGWGSGSGGSPTTTTSGAGGGGGAFSRLNALAVTSGDILYYNLAAGGAATLPGGDTWVHKNVNSSTSANLLAAGSTAPSDATHAGFPGQSSAGIGDAKYNGGFGANGDGVAEPAGGSGGGSSAGYIENGFGVGQYTGTTGGLGADAPVGAGRGGAGGNDGQPGSPGVAPGGGGGGGGRFGTSGAGGRGQINVGWIVSSAFNGSLFKTLSNLVVTSAAIALIAGAGLTPLASISNASSASVTVVAAASKTLGNATVNAAGNNSTYNANVSQTLGNGSEASAGSVSVTATAAKTLGNATLVSAVPQTATGSLSKTLGTVFISSNGGSPITAVPLHPIGTGVLGDPWTAIGDGVIYQLPNVTYTINGGVLNLGAVNRVLGNATSSGGSTAIAGGALSKILGYTPSTSDGTHPVIGTTSKTLNTVSLQTDALLDPHTGDVAKSLGNASLAAYIRTAGRRTVTLVRGWRPQSGENVSAQILALFTAKYGVMTATLGNVTLTTSSNPIITASVTRTLGNVTLLARIGGPTGDLLRTLGNATSTSAGTHPVSAQLTRTLGNVSTIIDGVSISIVGTVSKTLGTATLVGQGSTGPFGDLSKTLGNVSVTLSGGSVDHAAILAQTLNATSSATGSVLLGGALSAGTLGNVAISATGSLPGTTGGSPLGLLLGITR